MGSDTLRWLTIFLCAFDVGGLIALYLQVGKSFLPKLWMRVLMVSDMVWLIAGAATSYARFGEDLNWQTPAFAIAAGLELMALMGLHYWYGTETGREHARVMTQGAK